ncbi:MAG TPA: hypothetical protein VET87_00475 [Rubrivivax sp.]|nr:hypothetical protein [Rubrivivax sp.]
MSMNNDNTAAAPANMVDGHLVITARCAYGNPATVTFVGADFQGNRATILAQTEAARVHLVFNEAELTALGKAFTAQALDLPAARAFFKEHFNRPIVHPILPSDEGAA